MTVEADRKAKPEDHDWRTVDEGWGRRAVDFAALLEVSSCREYVAMHQRLGVGAGDPRARALARACVRNYGRMAMDFLAVRTMSDEEVLAWVTPDAAADLPAPRSDRISS